jgi:hypothetical protein
MIMFLMFLGVVTLFFFVLIRWRLPIERRRADLEDLNKAIRKFQEHLAIMNEVMQKAVISVKDLADAIGKTIKE